MADYTTGRTSSSWAPIALLLGGAIVLLFVLIAVFSGPSATDGSAPALDATPAAPAAEPEAAPVVGTD